MIYPVAGAMDNKYTKIAVILIIASFIIVSMVLAAIVLAVRGPSWLGKESSPPVCTREQMNRLAEDLVVKSATYRFDGIDGSLRSVKVESAENGGIWNLTYTFTTGHPGHGDRTDQVLAQVITSHDAAITFKDCKIMSAVCDGDWDLATDRQLAPK